MPRQLVSRSRCGACYSLYTLVSLVLLVCVTAPVALTQTAPPNRSVHPDRRKHAPPPLTVQYFYLLRLQLHLDQAADKHQQRGLQREAKELRSHLQGQLHFSPAQAGIVRQVATEYDEEYRAINAEVAPIAKADRDWVKANGKAAGPPPNRAQVHELGLRRKAALQDAIDKLNSQLGPEGAAQVETYLAKIFAPHDGDIPTQHKFSPPPKLHAPPDFNNPNGDSGVWHDLRAEGKQ
jgi:hypothetical protein